MAAELEKLRQEVKDLAKKFEGAGQDDLAALLKVDAQGFGAKAKIARRLGFYNFCKTPANPQEEMFTSLGLTSEQVAQHPDQITKDTKVYVGSLVHQDSNRKIIPIFNSLQNIEVYASIDRKIRRQSLEIDGRLAGKSADQVVGEFNQAGINVSDYGKDMLKGVKFTGNPRVIELIWLTGYDLGFKSVITTRDILERGNALGLEKCDAEVGPYQRFADKDQPMNTWYSIVMDPITDRLGRPSVFYLVRHEGGVWLRGRWADPGHKWRPEDRFVFSLRKSVETPNLGLLG